MKSELVVIAPWYTPCENVHGDKISKLNQTSMWYILKVLKGEYGI